MAKNKITRKDEVPVSPKSKLIGTRVTADGFMARMESLVKRVGGRMGLGSSWTRPKRFKMDKSRRRGNIGRFLDSKKMRGY